MESLDYATVAFLLVRPPAKVLSTHKLKNKAEHEALLEQAQSKHACVYYAVVERKGGKLLAKQPWTLDRSTIGNVKAPVVEVETALEAEPATAALAEKPEERLLCPYCKKPFSSTSGRTLHVKSKHPDMWDDYNET